MGRAIMVAMLVSGCAAQSVAPVTPLRVSRDGAPYGYADGAAAKRAAQAICAGQGRRLNPANFGHFIDGSWEFARGCSA